MFLHIDDLAARLPARPLTRFAPSPTGYLHLGHVVNAIFVWGIARTLGGRVLLRIEDHDGRRSRLEYERAILDDLAWLGFEADAGVVRQRDEPRAYEDALESLGRRHRVYACDCSRKDIAALVGNGQPRDTGEETRYPGRCRDRGLAIDGQRGIRVALEPGVEVFDDGALGPQAQTPAEQCGDLLLRDRDGFWTYQFAVAVDDHRQGIDLVIRGVDLLASTGRQIHLARMLGREAPPVFVHHGLLTRPDGTKLSKSSGDTGVREMRAAGASPADVIGRAAAAAGLATTLKPIRAVDVGELFVRRN